MSEYLEIEPTTYSVELTDTFAGEANYSYVTRAKVEAKNCRQIIRRAKKAVGLNGVRGRTYNYGDFIEFRPYGLNQVMFINPSWN